MLTHWDVKAPRVGVMARIPSTMAMTVPSSAFEGLGKCAAIPVTKLAALERMLALILHHLNAAKLAAPIMMASKVITPASTRQKARLGVRLLMVFGEFTTSARILARCDPRAANPAARDTIATTATTNLILDPGPDRPGAARQRSLSSLFMSAWHSALGGGSRLAYRRKRWGILGEPLAPRARSEL
jgi:hypothetical protein